MKIMSINAGSSSLKFSLFNMDIDYEKDWLKFIGIDIVPD